ncbi:hypothetical protein B5P44_00155 [Mycobacterium sp. CBMA 213]|uniref:Uncharacterized protein n=1 Tax=Mycolicibacterium sp. CBMA 213 TaxID=1968788 RepID=A0A343VR09_9MYCO|nr:MULTISPECIES: hypothetical protein [unclassified Mycolicibacterium]AVN58333.1 hypothetical protein B5P44_p00038 [Mycolicibacterium sp. CBMA 213]MUL60997.1 hypothetical protein [Mycolicibacterium sp. CBMA 335]MUM03234.1 hypothetical protein [Mycolicibacterium sp. CBMA 213]
MNITIAVTRSAAGEQLQSSAANIDVDHGPYDGHDPQYLDALTRKVNPLASSTVNAEPGDHIGVTITASADQPELVNVAWNFKN